MGTLDGERDVEWVAQEHNASVMREEAVLAKDPVSFSGFVHQSVETCGGLAQLGERLPCKQEVSGSIPLISTTRVASSVG